jgi:hypothetical protein
MSGLRYRTFLFWNALGGIIWGVGYTLLGYVVGVSFERILKEVGYWSIAVVGVVAVVAVVVQRVIKRRERRLLAAVDIPAGEPTDGPMSHDPATHGPTSDGSAADGPAAGGS